MKSGTDPGRLESLLSSLRAAVTTGNRDTERALHKQLREGFDNAGLMARVAQTYWHCGRLDQARELFIEASQRHSGDARVWLSYAVFLSRQKAFDEALPLFERSVRLDPENGTARHRYGWALATVGQTKAAVKELQLAVALEPGNAAAHYLLTTLTRYTPGHPHLQQLRDAVALPMQNRDRSRLLFALGRALEQTGQYDESFAAYREANRLRRAEFDYDIEHERHHVSWLIEHFSAAKVSKLRDKGFDSATPVFIVGLPRSGSTLLEHMLDCHPEISGAGETPLFAQTLEGLAGTSWLPGTTATIDPATVDVRLWNTLGKRYVEGLRQLAGLRQRLIDKQLFNYYLIGAIALALPKARFIHCVREPLDTCISCYTTTFRSGRPWVYELNEFVTAWELHRQLMTHWTELFPGRIHTLRYEDLIDDPQAELQSVLEHIGLHWSDQCLNFTASRRPVETASRGQVSRPVHTESVGRWRPFSAGLAGVIDRLQQ